MDKVSVWAGLGGCSPGLPPTCGTNLWQAGFLMTVTSGGSVAVHPFTEECTTTNCQPAYIWNGLFNTVNIALGDRVYVQVSYSTSGGVSFYMQDYGPGDTWTLQGGCPGNCIANYASDTESSEWVVEAPTAVASGSDCGVQQGYLCVLPNYGSFTIPNNSFGTTPLSADFALGLLRTIGDESHQPSDYSKPSYLTNGPISNSGGWTVTWGTTPG